MNNDKFENKNSDTGDEIELSEDVKVDVCDDDENAGMSISVDASSLGSEYETSTSFNILKEIRDWIVAIVLAVLVVGVIKIFLFDCVYVSGESMLSTLFDGDRLVIMKIGYQPEAGDIVVLDSHYKAREEYIARQKEIYGSSFTSFDEFKLRYIPWIQKRYGIEPYHYIKRIIAVEGETIDIDEVNNKVYIENSAIDEPYLDEGMRTYRGYEMTFPYKVEPAHAFVMGDNRENSRDSRSASLGTVPYKAIMGKVVFRFWPFNSLGTPR